MLPSRSYARSAETACEITHKALPRKRRGRHTTTSTMICAQTLSAAPIRASCVKRAWVIGSAAFTVSRGWA